MNELLVQLSQLNAVDYLILALITVAVPFLVGIGFSLASRVLPPKTLREITYDNLDKK
jgi:hypothetical protein